MHFIIGTAGHIDHGKTSLVKALTGIDTDRLKEEKERGITIDIGFAYWRENITIIDVPGHERFIRNMIAGVAAIDFALLVVAADDGVMPQTREHLDILQLLAIPRGAVIVTKSDLVDHERLEQVISGIRDAVKDTFLQTAPTFEISSVTGSGIPTLSDFLIAEAMAVSVRKNRGFFRLWVDRSFSVKGFGTVVTGTVISGSARTDQQLDCLPNPDHLRVRGLQIHQKSADAVTMGDRAAINMAGITPDEIGRGSLLVESGYLRAQSGFSANVHWLGSARPPKNGQKARVLVGTTEIFGKIHPIEPAELKPGQSGFMAIDLDEPLACIAGDRFILREINSESTLGGGRILDPSPYEKRKKLILSRFKSMDARDVIGALTACFRIATPMLLASASGMKTEEVEEILALPGGNYVRFGGWILDKSYHTEIEEKILSKLKAFHTQQPSQKGMPRPEVIRIQAISPDLVDALVTNCINRKLIGEENDLLFLPAHRITVSDRDARWMVEVETRLLESKFMPPDPEVVLREDEAAPRDIERVLRTLLQMGRIIKAHDLYFHHLAVVEARTILIDFIERNGHIRVTDFKQALNSSRKFTLSLLDYFDTHHITIRDGDVRVLKRDITPL